MILQCSVVAQGYNYFNYETANNERPSQVWLHISTMPATSDTQTVLEQSRFTTTGGFNTTTICG